MTRKAILDAAYSLLSEKGPGSVTVEAVSAKAGAGKPTIYRYWPNAQALLMAALIEQPAPDTSVHETESALADLARQLRKVTATFATRRGRQITMMLASAEQDSELAKAFRNQVILKSREEGRALLERGKTEGTIDPDAELETALDMIYGPIFYRLLVGHAPLNTAFTDSLLATALQGISAKS